MYVRAPIDEVACGGDTFQVCSTYEAGVLVVHHLEVEEDWLPGYLAGQEASRARAAFNIKLEPAWGCGDPEAWRRWAYWEARLTRVGWATVPRYYSTHDDVGSWGYYHGPRPVRERMAAGERLCEGGPWLVEEGRQGPEQAAPMQVGDYVEAVSVAIGRWSELREAWLLSDAAGRLGVAPAVGGPQDG